MISRHSHGTLATPIALAIGVCTFLLFGLLGLFLHSPTLSAQSQPEALGSISGVARNEEGDPLPNIKVDLYQSSYYGNSYIRTATTDSSGAYQLLSILPGMYQIRFQDNGKLYTSLYYGGAATTDDAVEVAVSGNEVTGVDIELALGGTISVTIEPTPLITNTSVALYLFAKTATGHWSSFETHYWPYFDTDLTFYGVPSGSYKLCTQYNRYSDFNSANWAECFDNVLYDFSYPPEDASEIVMSGATHKMFAFRFGDLTQLQGVVRSTEGQPLAHVDLLLLTTPNNNGNAAAVTSTDAQGYFQFGLLSSFEYVLQAVDPRREYLPTYYGGSPGTQQAQPIQIDLTSRYSLTMTLQRAGSIRGKVLLEGGGVPFYPGITIYKEPSPGNSWGENRTCTQGECFTNYDPATGVYTITGLTTGIYRVGASVSNYLSPGSTSFYGGKNVESAANIAVTTGKATPNINFTIGEGDFESAIQGRATANGAPVAGIEVGLFQYDPNNGIFYPPPIVMTKTDLQGSYRFDGLANSSYAVAFRDPKSVYAMSFYGGSYITPTQILITQTRTVTGINVALSPGATVQGKVERAAGKNPADISISLIVPPYPSLNFLRVETDIDGNFEIKSVPPGSYWISAQPPIDAPRPYYERFYPTGLEQNSADVVAVGPGDVIKGINIPVDLVPSAYLPTIEGNRPPKR